jgi:DNA-binding NarL/FixJ family response regulator
MLRIMIVDDHDLLRKTLRLVLSTCPGYEVVGEAEDGKEAVQLCKTLLPDVVLMDLKMPVMDGITATRLIKAGDSTTLVIILSRLDDQEIIQQAMQAGAARCLSKEITAKDLCASLCEIIETT